MTLREIVAIHEAWSAAFRERTGLVCIHALLGQDWHPRYLLAPDGRAIGVC